MTTIPNWLLTALTLLAMWGAMIALFVLGTVAWEWIDTWKKRRESDKEYAALCRSVIDYLESEMLK